MDFSKYALGVGQAPKEMESYTSEEMRNKRTEQRNRAYREELSQKMQAFDDKYENLTDAQLQAKLEELQAKRNELMTSIEKIKNKNEESNNRVGQFKQGIKDFASKLSNWGTTPTVTGIEQNASWLNPTAPQESYAPDYSNAQGSVVKGLQSQPEGAGTSGAMFGNGNNGMNGYTPNAQPFDAVSYYKNKYSNVPDVNDRSLQYGR